MKPEDISVPMGIPNKIPKGLFPPTAALQTVSYDQDTEEDPDMRPENSVLTGYVSRILLKSASGELFKCLGMIQQQLNKKVAGSHVYIKGGTNLLLMFVAMLNSIKRSQQICTPANDIEKYIREEVHDGIFSLSDLDTSIALPENATLDQIEKIHEIVVGELNSLNERLKDTVNAATLSEIMDAGKKFEFDEKATSNMLIYERKKDGDTYETIVLAGPGSSGIRYTSVNLSVARPANFVLLRNKARAFNASNNKARSGEILDVTHTVPGTETPPHKFVDMTVRDSDRDSVCEIKALSLSGMADDLFRTIAEAAYEEDPKIIKRIKRAAVVAYIMDQLLTKGEGKPIYVETLLLMAHVGDVTSHDYAAQKFESGILPYAGKITAKNAEEALDTINGFYIKPDEFKNQVQKAIEEGLAIGTTISRCMTAGGGRDFLEGKSGMVLKLPVKGTEIGDPMDIDVLPAKQAGGGGREGGMLAGLLGGLLVLGVTIAFGSANHP